MIGEINAQNCWVFLLVPLLKQKDLLHNFSLSRSSLNMCQYCPHGNDNTGVLLSLFKLKSCIYFTSIELGTKKARDL